MENNKDTPQKKGIELDELDLKGLVSLRRHSEEHMTGKQSGTRMSARKPMPPLQKSILIILAVFATISVSAVIFYWDNMFFDIPLYSKKGPVKYSKNYKKIGPILTSAGKAGTIKFKLAINCKQPGLKAKVTQQEALIKTRLLELMSDPAVEQIIKEKKFDELRPYMTKKINETLKGDYIDEIYFAELVTY